MKEVIRKDRCTGCTACMNICNRQAITMQDDYTGFKYPKIDESKCINCGLCMKTCPVLTTKENISINKCYVGYDIENNIKERSSSGGVFSILANYVLDKSGIVIGAAFEKKELKHIAITNKKELERLKGSKYLQSNLENIFNFIKNNISENLILFVGLPCQVAGLKSFLKKDYKNLICVDLVCHGVPSPKVFLKYIEELEENTNSKLIDYNFRDKTTGWNNYSNTAIFKNKKITELHSKNKYMKIFLSDVALRKSCFKCNFKLGNKYSDITLGDFWGVQNYYPEMYNEKGVSAIIVNTSKGKSVFDNIKNKLEYKKCNIKEITGGNPSLKKSVEYNKNCNKFFKNFEYLTIDEMVKKFGKPKRSLWIKIIRKIKRIFKAD